jgi:hypothetical protein
MKKYLLFILAASFLTGTPACKKTVDKKIENYIIDIMTDGRWYMYNYEENGLDITYEFDGYEFQFYKNEIVDGFLNNVATRGTWKGDLSNLSMTAEFPAAGNPLKKLNATWKITDSYTNAVFAESTTGTVVSKMKLVKK